MAANREGLKKVIDKGKITLPPDVKVSPACMNLITMLLVHEADSRIEWKNFFEHPFIKYDENTFAVYYNNFISGAATSIQSSPQSSEKE